jgi:tetratricopeptide (TPR) repeat protein
MTLSNIGWVSLRKGDPDAAEAQFREALAVRAKVHGAESMQVAWRKYALAELLREARRYGEAERQYRESLALRHKLQGEEGPDVARGLYGLAGVLCDQHRYVESDSLGQLVTLYTALGKPVKAAEYRALLLGAHGSASRPRR